MTHALAIFIGGGLGSLCRYGISQLFRSFEWTNLPWATLSSNMLSSALLGLVALKVIQSEHPFWYAFLAIGFCGGFSTFSTFSFETVQLIKSGQAAWAILNILVSVALCVALLFALSKSVK